MKVNRSDEELVEAISNNDEESVNELFERYKGKAFLFAKAFYVNHILSGISIDEYYAITFHAIYVAAKKFKADKESLFSSYYKSVAENALKNYDKENSYLQHAKTFFGKYSLDEAYLNSHKIRSEELGDSDQLIYENIDILDLTDTFKKISHNLSKKQINAYVYYLKGYSALEISNKMKLPLSTTYHMIDYVSKTLAKILKK